MDRDPSTGAGRGSAPEIHLFLLWPRALGRSAEILNDIRRRFFVRDVMRVEWSRKQFPRDLTRFYGQMLPWGSHKQRHCGVGPFLVIVVEDADPTYELRQTTSGALDTVNAAMFDAKQRYRAWTGGGHRIHATLHPKEVDHDLFLLFGRRADFYEHASGSAWDGRIRTWRGDLIGATSWRSVPELLEAIDVTMEYVLLDDLDRLPVGAPLLGADVLNILVEDRWWAAVISNARRTARRSHPARYRARVDGRSVLLEIREFGDGYFDADWQRSVLRDRVRDRSGIFVPGPVDRFYTSLYRGLVHSPEIPAGLERSLSLLASEQSPPAGDCSRSEFAKRRLDDFLRQRGYRYTRPDDPSVGFKVEVAGSIERRRKNPLGARARTIQYVAGSLWGVELAQALGLVPEPGRDAIRRARADLFEQAQRWSDRRVGLALLYHRLGDPPGDPAHELVPSLGNREFEVQLNYLKKRYKVVPASQLLAAIGERRRGQRLPVAVTFDDDLHSHLRIATPLLRRLGLPATFFLCGASLDGTFRFWWEDLQLVVDRGLHDLTALRDLFPHEVAAAVKGIPRAIHRVAELIEQMEPGAREHVAAELRRAVGDDVPEESPLGAQEVTALAAEFEIGFHPLRHDLLPGLDDDALERAMTDGRDALEALMGRRITLISYPHGKADRRVADAARAAGYELGFTGRSIAIEAGADPLLLGRFEPRTSSSGAFALQIVRALARSTQEAVR